jgi:DsbC/DsbD-like thiol-disulfide interchange protein
VRSAFDPALAVLALWFGACAQTAGPPRLQLAPIATVERVAAGSSVQVAVRVTLPEGVHVNANKPRDPSLIPIVLTVERPAGVTVTEIVYPAPIDLEQQGALEPLAVYEREFRIAVVLRMAKDLTPGEIVVRARLRYQACDERTCYIPAKPARAGRFEWREVLQSCPVRRVPVAFPFTNRVWPRGGNDGSDDDAVADARGGI